MTYTAISQEEEDSWERIMEHLAERTLVPIIGPGVITFGEGDEPLYPWLVRRLAERLGVNLPNDGDSFDINKLIRLYLANNPNKNLDKFTVGISQILKDPNLLPGPLLESFSSLSHIANFLTLGFDPLLERALKKTRNNGFSDVHTWVNGKMPKETPALCPSRGSSLGYLFGRFSSARGEYHLWEPDILEFILRLNEEIKTREGLVKVLSENNLLVIGTRLSDWTVRFLMRIVRQTPFTDSDTRNLFIADESSHFAEETVFFYSISKGTVQPMRCKPVDFMREFCKRAKALELEELQLLPPSAVPVLKNMQQRAPDGSIFISYYHEDFEPAMRVARVLQERGCRIWIDRERLSSGDNFENYLGEAVKKHCRFFLSLISRNTLEKQESYFLKERRWAGERSLSFAENAYYYFPLVIDDGIKPEEIHNEPSIFQKMTVDFAVDGEISSTLVEKLYQLQQ